MDLPTGSMIHLQEHIALKPLTTFDIGGRARWFVDVDSEQELQKALAEAARLQTHFVVVAGGSNLLVADEGYPGLVIRIAGGRTRIAGEHVFVDAGRNLEEAIRQSAAAGLVGWEKLAGIPGTVGGAVRGNAGAFGTEMKDVVVGVRAFNTRTGGVRSFEKSQCDFSYRQSYFKRNPEWIITSAIIKLEQGNARESEQLIDETIAERNRRHLQDVKAGGSFFMNPVAPTALCLLFEREKGVASRGRRVPAGWLIDKAGLKGARIGDAVASEQHPNYLVNVGEARAADVLALSHHVKKTVHEQFGVALEEEVTLLGFN